MLKKTVLIIILLILGIFLFLYNGTYSEGTRAGIIMKLSKKGIIFKTWEGQMNLQTFGAVKDPKNIISETFTFSIEKGNKELINKLENAALSGNRVNLKYEERYVNFFWLGDTKVFAVDVVISNIPASETDSNDDNFPLRN